MTPSPLSPRSGSASETSSPSPDDRLRSVDFASRPEEEEQRLAALYRYEILDTPPEEAFDRITSLAADLFDAPLAFVSLVDANRQWMKSCVGTDLREIDLESSICVHAIQSEGVTVIPDTTADERVAGNPVVTGEPCIRFYAGAPLTTSDGHCIGTVCVLDTETRQDVAESNKKHLLHLAGLVIDELELRREVRARRDRERELEAARRDADDARSRAEEANETMSRFFAGVAHDLQNPLTALLMSANLVEPHVPDDAQKYVDRIRSAGERMRVMTSSLMELSRLRSGTLSLTTAPHDVVRVIREATSIAEDFPEAKGRTVRLDVPGDAVVAHVDPDALQRVLGNLVGNAFKHTGADDAVSVAVRVVDASDAPSASEDADAKASEASDVAVRIEQASRTEANGADASGPDAKGPDANEAGAKGAGANGAGASLAQDGETGRCVVIDVCDTGPGIDADALDSIFDPFTRGSDGTEGSGLGLAVARDLTEAMNGTLTVDSTVGEGTCFHLTLPAADPS